MAPVLLEGQRYLLTYTIPSYNTKWHEVSANAHTVFILSVHMVLKTREPHCKTVEVTLAFFRLCAVYALTVISYHNICSIGKGHSYHFRN